MAVTVLNSAGTATGMQTFADAGSNNIPLAALDSTRAYYRASASFVPVTANALVLLQVQGSASKTVRITRVTMSGSAATAIATMVAYTQRTSTAGVTGTAEYFNVVNSAPASFANAPVLQYTVEWIEDGS